MKFCSRCKVNLDLSLFGKNKTRPDGLSHNCKQCCAQMTKKFYNEYPEKRSDKWLKTRYGISIEIYNEMLKQQDGKCFICRKMETGGNTKWKRLAVDHCHVSGKIRGLLCQKCNTVLGLIKDDVEVLKAAIEYLKRDI